MKRYLILLFIFIQGLVFSTTKTLSDIKTLKFDVVEKTNIKSKNTWRKWKTIKTFRNERKYNL